MNESPQKVLKKSERAKLNTFVDKVCKERIKEMARLNRTSITKQLESMINGFWEHNQEQWNELRREAAQFTPSR